MHSINYTCAETFIYLTNSALLNSKSNNLIWFSTKIPTIWHPTTVTTNPLPITRDYFFIS